jgi:hypothetical protein
MGNDPWLAALPEHWPWQGLQNGVRPEARLSESCSPGDRLGFHAGRTPYEILPWFSRGPLGFSTHALHCLQST